MLAYGTRFSRFVTVLAVLTLLISTIGGCSLTRHSQSADKSGFLGNYDELKKDDSDDALLTYHNPDAKWSHYTKVKLDSVSIWQDQKTSELSAKEQQALTNHLYSALHRELGMNFTMVNFTMVKLTMMKLQSKQCRSMRMGLKS